MKKFLAWIFGSTALVALIYFGCVALGIVPLRAAEIAAFTLGILSTIVGLGPVASDQNGRLIFGALNFSAQGLLFILLAFGLLVVALIPGAVFLAVLASAIIADRAKLGWVAVLWIANHLLAVAGILLHYTRAH